MKNFHSLRTMTGEQKNDILLFLIERKQTIAYFVNKQVIFRNY